MKVSRGLAFVLLGLLGALPTALPSNVRADDPEPEVSDEPAEEAVSTRDRWDRVLAAEIVGGVDTPYGLVGGAIVIAPIRYLALDLGGGVSRDGGRVAGGARLVLPHQNASFGLRVGFAGGPLTWDTAAAGQTEVLPDGADVPIVNQHRTWDFVGFLDVSLHLEVRSDIGLYGRLVFGIEHTLATADRCEVTGGDGTCNPGGSHPTRTYIGLALGYAFDL